MGNKTAIFMQAKEVFETTEVSELAEKLATGKWMAVSVCQRPEGYLWVLIRVEDQMYSDGSP